MYPPQPAAPANDRTTLFGVLGIVGAFCCPVLGVVFGFLCLQASKKAGKPPTLAYIGIVLSILTIIGYSITYAARR